MGGLFGSTTIKGNRITDLAAQTSTVGKPIPRGYGKCKVTEPNVIWTAGKPTERRKLKRQGKGGVKTEEYIYTLSYAVAFMAGPVFGYLTIKRGGKVVYTTDPNAPIEDIKFAQRWQQKARIYLGTEEQLPDPTIEAKVGVGKVSAFRGLSYIVVIDDDVTNEGGAVPQYEAVIIASPPEAYLTSKPYPLEDMASLSTSFTFGQALLRELMIQARAPVESTATGFTFGVATLRPPIIDLPVTTELISRTLAFGPAVLRDPVVNLGPQGEDGLDKSFSLGNALIRNAAISTDQSNSPEKLERSISFGGANLYAP